MTRTVNNYENNYDPSIHYQHTSTSLQNTFHSLDSLLKNNIHSDSAQNQKTRRQHTFKTPNTTKQNRKKRILQIITIPTFNLNIQIDHFKTTFHILNTLPTYEYIHFKTRFMCPRSIARVPSSQALPGYLITVHHLCAFLL